MSEKFGDKAGGGKEYRGSWRDAAKDYQAYTSLVAAGNAAMEKAQERIAKLQDKQQGNVEALAKLQERAAKLQEQAGSGNMKSAKALDAVQKQIQQKKLKSSLITSQIQKMQEKSAKLSQQMVGYEEKQLALKQQQNEVGEELAGQFDGMFNSIEGIIDSIPGGGFIKKAFNFDGVKAQFQESIVQGFTQAGGGAQGIVGGLRAAIPAAGTLVATLGPIILIGAVLIGIIAAVKFLVDAFKAGDQAAKDMAMATGMSKKEASALNVEIVESGINLKKATEFLGAMSEEMNGMPAKMSESVKVAEGLNKQYGISMEVLGKVNARMMAQNTSQGENLSSVAQANALLGARTGVLMTTKDLMEGIANLSEAEYNRVSGSPEELAKAVRQKKLYNLEIGRSERVTSGLLDVESTLSKQFEAQIIFGKDFNLQKAMQLKAEGDHAGAYRELQKEAKKLGGFQNMNGHQQELYLELTGKTRDEMNAQAAERKKALAKERMFNMEMTKILTGQVDIGHKLKDIEGLKFNFGGKQYSNLMDITKELKAQGKANEEIEQIMRDQVTAQSELVVEADGTAKKFALQDVVGASINGQQNELFMKQKNNQTAAEKIEEVIGNIKTQFGVILFDRLQPLLEEFGLFNDDAESQEKTQEKINEIIDKIVGGVTSIVGLFKDLGKLAKLFKAYIDFVLRPIYLIRDVFSGLGMILSGDILGGLAKIGDAIVQFVLAPFKYIARAIDWLFGTDLGSGMDSFQENISFTGALDRKRENDPTYGMTEGSKAEEEALKKLEDAQLKELEENAGVDDFIYSRKDGITPFNKDDLIIGGTNLMGTKGTTGGGTSLLEAKLDELIAAVRAGGTVNMDGRKVGEIIGGFGGIKGIDS